MKQFLVSFFTAGFLLCARAQQCDNKGVCDTHEMCPVWQEQGQCEEEKDYMKKHCPVSCNINSAKADPVPLCKDFHSRCKVWADLGECTANRNMKKYCAKSCDLCDVNSLDLALEDDPDCVDNHANCGFWAEKGECESNPTYMLANCMKSCGSCPNPAPRQTSTRILVEGDDVLEESKKYGVKQRAEGERRALTIARIEEAMTYMQSEQVVHLPQKVRETCQNRHELCAFWAVIGECEKNQAYMATNCAVVCMSCHMIDFETRCPPLSNAIPALLPGDMNKMFERIVETAPGNRTLTDAERKELADNNMTEYTVTVHSRPSAEPSTEVSVVVDKSLPPWVITFDDFMLPEECDALIQLGYKYEYKRSQDVGAAKFDGSHEGVQSTRRTSENAWCSDHHGCRKEEMAVRIHERMSKVMGIPPENSEDLQMLKYEKGQFYRVHHDYIPHQKDRQCGPRILTFFLYLSDVEEGGGTNFPQLNITVMPKKGRALLWPSTLNAEPMVKDARTSHQALDVIEGVKFATNGWIHMYDYVTSQKKGCN